jgi:large subunit ribosomal protein L23
MSLLSLSKRILGKNEKKAPARNKKVTSAATAAKKSKQTVDAHALTTGIIGLTEVVSEKGIKEQIQGTVVFKVLPHVTKEQIRQVVETRFGVQVKSVRTLLAHPKTRRRGVTEGKTNRYKKAYVTVDNVQSLVNQK